MVRLIEPDGTENIIAPEVGAAEWCASHNGWSYRQLTSSEVQQCEDPEVMDHLNNYGQGPTITKTEYDRIMDGG